LVRIRSTRAPPHDGGRNGCHSHWTIKHAQEQSPHAASGASENVDLARVDLGVRERGDDRVADEGMRRLSRLRAARIGRLSYPDDGGIRGHDFARQRVERQ
jgi:hypothetical protein